MSARVTLCAPHPPDAYHLRRVIEFMARSGAPVIRAVWMGAHWQAIEGSHRIAAARRLNLLPQIVQLQPSDRVANHDIWESGHRPTASRIVETIAGWRYGCVPYWFIGLPVGPSGIIQERASLRRSA